MSTKENLTRNCQSKLRSDPLIAANSKYITYQNVLSMRANVRMLPLTPNTLSRQH